MGLYDEANIKYGGFAAFARLVSDLYVPSIICILVYAEITKKYRLPLYLLAFVTVCIPPFFLGSRTNAVIMVGIIFLIYYFYNTITRKQVVIFVSVVYMLLLSLIFIRYSRQMQDVNDTAEVVESINNKGDSNPITSMISEMGWSLYPVIKTIEIKEEPNEHFLYGTSILWGMTSVFPNLFWDIHPAKMYADMSDWITKKLRFSYGIGYSLVAEAYANFGFLGFIFLFFVSVLFMKLFNYSTLMNKSNLILQVCSLIFLWFVIRIVRNNFMDTFRSLVFFVLPFFFMIKYYANRYKKTLLIKNRRKRINKAIRQFT